MATVIKMPQLGESVVEGTVLRWLKEPGDGVERLEPLLEISTDKVDTEVPSPASGILLEVMVGEGETVAVGAALGLIGAVGEETQALDAAQPVGAAHPAVAATVAPDDSPDDSPPEPAAAGPQSASVPAESGPTRKVGGRAFISPVVARIAAEQNVDLDQVPGTGQGGRITKKDILAYLAQPAAAEPPTSGAGSGTDEYLQPLTTMRRAIARHMLESKSTSPHVTTIFEADLTAVVQHREAVRADFGAKGLKLTFTPYFVMAVIAGLKAVPEVNSRFSEQGIVVSRRIHIGMAVAVEEGLIVPVIRDADEKNLQGLARTLTDLADRARSGALVPDDVQGGTFTISNHGTGGSLIGTPIINQPQAGILGVGAIVKRPVVRGGNSLLPSADDAIVIRPMCYLSFSFDHRILDGGRADAFLATVKDRLEQWDA